MSTASKTAPQLLASELRDGSIAAQDGVEETYTSITLRTCRSLVKAVGVPDGR